MIARPQTLRAETARFARFCGVGGVGFIADAGLLFCFTAFWAFDPFLARVLSILIALTITWGLHRLWTFRSQRSGRLAEWSRFAIVNGGGGTVNYCVYAAILLISADTPPLLALMAGSAIALLANYFGSRFWVFRSSGNAVVPTSVE